MLNNFIPQVFYHPLLDSAPVIFISIVVAVIMTSIVKFVLYKLAKYRKVDASHMKFARTEMFLVAFIILIGCYLTINLWGLSPRMFELIERLILTAIVINIGSLLVGIKRVIIVLFIEPYVQSTETKIDDQILSLTQKTTTGIIYLLTFVYCFTVWEVEITPLIASLGIAGLAVALALQPMLSNIFSGISMYLDKTFALGDVIKFNTITGTVYDVGLRSTKIKTFDNEIITVPNNALANAEITNLNKPDPSIRVNIEFGVEYGVDPEYVKKIVIEELNDVKYRDQSKPVRIMFTGMGDSSLDFKAMYWVQTLGERWVAHQEGITRIYRRLYKEDLGIPFPQRTVWLRDEGKAKAPSPHSRKFSSVQGKYLANFGHEMEDKKVVPEEEQESKEDDDKTLLGRAQSKVKGLSKSVFKK